MQTILNEYVHTIQGPLKPLEETMFDSEVEAYNLSYHWYKALFNKKNRRSSPGLTHKSPRLKEIRYTLRLNKKSKDYVRNTMKKGI